MERELPLIALQILKGRWTVVVVSFFIMACAGATYIYSIYSSAIKYSLDYDQTTIGTLSFFKDLGANLGIVSGLLNEVTPAWVVLAVGAGMNMFGYLMVWMAVTHRIARPPLWQMYLFLCIGANSQTFANTGVLVTCVKNFPQSRGVVLGLLKGFVGLSGAIFIQLYHAIYNDDTKGVILLAGWLPSVVSLMFMFVIRPTKPEMDKNEGKHFYSFLYLVLGLAMFLMLAIIVENQVKFSPTAYKFMGLLTVLFVLANVFIGIKAELERQKQQAGALSLKEGSLGHTTPNGEGSFPKGGGAKEMQTLGKGGKDKDCVAADTSQNHFGMHSKHDTHDALPHSGLYATPGDAPAHDPLQVGKDGQEHAMPFQQGGKEETQPDGYGTLNQQTSTNVPHTSMTKASSKASSTPSMQAPSEVQKKPSFFSNWPKRGDDFTIPQALLSVDMWILFIATTCGVGATLTAIDNMGQIGASLGYSPVAISTFVSLISIWNFLGRVISGFLSEMLLQRYHFPRTFFFSIVIALACVGHLLIAFPRPGSLYIASILVGLCFGAQWPVMFAVISELFGLKYYATLYNCGAVASPLGSYLLNVRVAGYLYDREARRQHLGAGVKLGGGQSLTCDGPSCFRLTFLIMTAVSLFGSLISLLLVLRTREFYSQDIYARFRTTEEKEEMPAV